MVSAGSHCSTTERDRNAHFFCSLVLSRRTFSACQFSDRATEIWQVDRKSGTSSRSQPMTYQISIRECRFQTVAPWTPTLGQFTTPTHIDDHDFYQRKVNIDIELHTRPGYLTHRGFRVHSRNSSDALQIQIITKASWPDPGDNAIYCPMGVEISPQNDRSQQCGPNGFPLPNSKWFTWWTR